MEDTLDKIRIGIEKQEEINVLEVKEMLNNFLKLNIKGLHIENYIGDYPTFMEPVYLGNNVKIGDDVLIGPNVYIGDNSEIGDYVELSNTIIFEDVKIGKNFKLNNCIIARESILNFNNLTERNCILKGKTDTKENLIKISF
jgi:NDP-sugar pyrophosphorylase family protein